MDPSSTTTYTVYVTDQFGCSNSCSTTVTVLELLDYGDAPEYILDNGNPVKTGFPVMLADDGARHREGPGVISLRLGTLIDFEYDAIQNGYFGDGDDYDNLDDEDGVTFLTPLNNLAGFLNKIRVVTPTPGGYLNAWIDLDDNLDWYGPGEHFITDLPLTANTTDIPFYLPGGVGFIWKTTYLRFRYTSQPGTQCFGLAEDGEVEDHKRDMFPLMNLRMDQAHYGPGEPFIPMVNVEANLMRDGVVVDSSYTNENGRTQFYGFPAGIYSIQYHCTKPWGGANPADALLILKHFAGLTTLTGLALEAADENGNGYPNASDALGVVKRWTGITHSFPAGDWVYEQPVDTAGDNGFYNHPIEFLCVGDVNGSYDPSGTRQSPAVYLNLKDRLAVDNSGEIIIPVRVTQELSAGAIALVLEYPQTIEIEDVLMPERENGNLIYNAHAGELRVSWYSLIPLVLHPGEILAELKVKVKTGGLPDIIFKLGDESLLTDENALIIPDVVLEIPSLVLPAPEAFDLSLNLPNPFSSVTEISYSLPEEGNVTLKVFNIFGEEIQVLLNSENQKAGKYTVYFDGTQLATGVYLYRIDIEGETRTYSKSRRMVVER
ncbi:MAG: T9SS type A sorting domain-containing protein [Bacteroidetes bacterium]|nr:T9SS type A sorting domain-containing protein [Bacteroidota bacterium]